MRAAAAGAGALVRRPAAAHRLRQLHGPWVQRRGGAGAGTLGARPRPPGHAPGRLLLHDRPDPGTRAGRRLVHAALESGEGPRRLPLKEQVGQGSTGRLSSTQRRCSSWPRGAGNAWTLPPEEPPVRHHAPPPPPHAARRTSHCQGGRICRPADRSTSTNSSADGTRPTSAGRPAASEPLLSPRLRPGHFDRSVAGHPFAVDGPGWAAPAQGLGQVALPGVGAASWPRGVVGPGGPQGVVGGGVGRGVAAGGPGGGPGTASAGRPEADGAEAAGGAVGSGVAQADVGLAEPLGAVGAGWAREGRVARAQGLLLVGPG